MNCYDQHFNKKWSMTLRMKDVDHIISDSGTLLWVCGQRVGRTRNGNQVDYMLHSGEVKSF